jgi:hypothetical protein
VGEFASGFSAKYDYQFVRHVGLMRSSTHRRRPEKTDFQIGGENDATFSRTIIYSR